MKRGTTDLTEVSIHEFPYIASIHHHHHHHHHLVLAKKMFRTYNCQLLANKSQSTEDDSNTKKKKTSYPDESRNVSRNKNSATFSVSLHNKHSPTETVVTFGKDRRKLNFAQVGTQNTYG